MSQTIAFLGLGAMGSRMAARLLQAGYQVNVWNRNPFKAQALVDAGARLAINPRDAATGADFVIAMVRDDEASHQVWCDEVSGALVGMRPGAIAIESSTLSIEAVRVLATAAAAHGVAFLDAPVSGSRPAAQAGLLVYLVGGDKAAFEQAEPVLLCMGSSAQHVGPVGHGAVAKLVTNALLGIHVTALAELIGLLNHQGVSAQQILQAVARTPVWAPVDHYLSGSMQGGNFEPQFPVELIAKDFGYTVAAAGGAAQAPMISAALAVYERAMQSALGSENMTAVAKLYTS
jgi:3-hydroxyisobutyrate dehydrogenase